MPAVTVDQAKLVLNAFAATFQNNLIAKDLVTWRKYDNEMNDRNGLTVVEQVGPRYTVTQTTSGVQDLSSGTQDTVFGSEQFKVDQVFGSSMGWGDFVKIRDIGEARESEAITNAATNLAEKIDAYILRTVALAANNSVGTAGNAIDSLDDFTAGYVRLKEEGVSDTDLRAVLTYGDQAALASNIVGLPALDDIASGIYREGFTGKVGGIPTMFTQQLPTLITGTRTNGAVNGANQGVNYKDVAVSSAPGRYLTQTIAADGFGANATIKDGEVFTIAGVNAYDNRLGASLGRLQQFRVVGDHTADGTGAIASLRIFPALVVPGSGSGGDVNVNTAHATVTAAPADNAVITWWTSASASVKPRVVLAKDAIQVNTADLIMPATGVGMRKSLTKVPLSVRMWKNSNFATGAHDVRFDVVLSANVRDRRRLVRINGQ
jgi:hypothetical protein